MIRGSRRPPIPGEQDPSGQDHGIITVAPVVLRLARSRWTWGASESFAWAWTGIVTAPLATTENRFLAMASRVSRLPAWAKSEGRVVLEGGATGSEDEGYFLAPSIVADVDNGSETAQEEIFGPVLAVIRAGDLDDAVVVVEWGEGIVERLSERHLDIRLERGVDTEVRTAIWRWSRS